MSRHRGNLPAGFLALTVVLAAGCGGAARSAPPPGRESLPAVSRPAVSAPAEGPSGDHSEPAVPPAVGPRSLAGVKLENLTGGEVEPATARAWAEAVLRTWAYLESAANAGDERFFTTGRAGHAEPGVDRESIVGDAANPLGEALASGRRLELRLGTITGLRLVRIGEVEAARIRGLRQVATRYAFVTTTRGPWEERYLDPTGQRPPEVRVGLNPGQTNVGILGGEYRDDPGLGALWYLGFSFSCAAEWLASVCGS